MNTKDIYQRQYFRGYVRKDRFLKTERGLRQVIDRVAEAHNFEVSDNKEKIINAKLMMCKGDYKMCPCDHRPESKRYCGSPFCVQETRENGRCHCGLFRVKGKEECDS